MGDPEQKKPEDWVDNAKIDDPEDSKPEDWEKPEHIPDPDATKPEDWDDEMDGEWEPAMIDNPEYKGEDAKGIAKYAENCIIGFDLWQVKSGTIFDNLIITDDPAAAKKDGEDFWAVTKTGEKTMKDEQDEVERKKAEEEAANAPDDEDEDDLDEDEEDDLPEDEDEDDIDHDEL